MLLNANCNRECLTGYFCILSNMTGITCTNTTHPIEIALSVQLEASHLTLGRWKINRGQGYVTYFVSSPSVRFTSSSKCKIKNITITKTIFISNPPQRSDNFFITAYLSRQFLVWEPGGQTEHKRQQDWPWALSCQSSLVLMNEIFINPSVPRLHTLTHTQTNHIMPSQPVICLQILVNYIHLSTSPATGLLSLPLHSSWKCQLNLHQADRGIIPPQVFGLTSRHMAP